jgi:hypothetical protein
MKNLTKAELIKRIEELETDLFNERRYFEDECYTRDQVDDMVDSEVERRLQAQVSRLQTRSPETNRLMIRVVS